jgi:hypothetical protein
MRNGQLLLPYDKKSLLAAVLVEADFYGLEGLLQIVKTKCYINMNSTKQLKADSEEAMVGASALELSAILESVHFPDMYYKAVSYYRVISVHSVPDNKFVNVKRFAVGAATTHTDEFIPYHETITYERVLDGKVFVEPLVRYETWSLTPSPTWTHERNFFHWPVEVDKPDRDRAQVQMLPVTWWLAANRYEYWLGNWELATMTVHQLLEDQVECTLRRADGTKFKRFADVAEVYRCRDATHTKLFMYYENTGKLTDVSTFSNFVSLGDVVDDPGPDDDDDVHVDSDADDDDDLGSDADEDDDE